MKKRELQIQETDWKPLLRTPLLWIALIAAISPSLIDLGHHFLASPWTWYCLFFPGLFFAVARNEPQGQRRHLWGLALLLGGLALTLLPSLGGGELIRYGRPGIPLSVIGLALFAGRPSLQVSLMALWIIPIPSAALKIADPIINKLFFALASFPYTLLSRDIQFEGSTLNTAAGSLALTEGQSLFIPLALLTGLGWFSVLWKAQKSQTVPTFHTLVLHSAYFGSWAIPIYLGTLFMACGLTAWGASSLCALWLNQLAVWASGLVFLWIALRSNPREVE